MLGAFLRTFRGRPFKPPTHHFHYRSPFHNHRFRLSSSITAPFTPPSSSSSSLSSTVASVPVTRPIVGWWLLGNSALVFSIVIVGGLTRLTESGLSMVDWSLLGSRPPMNQEEWEAYFEKYKQFPEYKINNKGMTVEEFKSIYWYEYVHRMMGRFIGAYFILPGAYFIARKYVSPRMMRRILGIGALIGGQGLLGWYMVKSGLDHKIVENNEVPRVSQYRLAAHLSMAFLIYTGSLLTGLGILSRRASPSLVKSTLKNTSFTGFRRHAHATTGLIFVTAVSGAFVAGLDAGLIYNTFPLMGDRWIPSDMWALSPPWKNFFENPSTVQFDHRTLAITTYCAILACWFWSRRVPVPPHIRIASNALLAVGSVQVALGISTLLWLVPVPLAAAHQGGSLTLLTVSLWMVNALKYVPK